LVYDPLVLSEEEKERFRAALGDGFIQSTQFSSEVQIASDEAALPEDVKPGFLQHRAFYPKFEEAGEELVPVLSGAGLLKYPWGEGEGPFPAEVDSGLVEHQIFDPALENGGEELVPAESAPQEGALDPAMDDNATDEEPPPNDESWPEFWSSGLYKECPVNFHLPEVQRYFEEQKAAYLAYASHWIITHISKGGNWMNTSIAKLALGSIIEHSARAGRLIEQYYWKFHVEEAAVRGARTLKGAQSGGAARARAIAPDHKAERATWQAEADAIWKKAPRKSKNEVASILLKKLRSVGERCRRRIHDDRRHHCARSSAQRQRPKKDGDQAIGRSHGGLTTKIDALGNPANPRKTAVAQ
jgi:hypothetical protein